MKLEALLIFAIVGFVAAAEMKDVVFRKIGQYTGKNSNGFTYQKSYYGPKVFSTLPWFQAKLMCQQYGLELVGFESVEEENAVIKLAANFPNMQLFNDWTIVDGVAGEKKNKVEWYHANGIRIPYVINWEGNQPDSAGDQEAFILAKKSGDKLVYNDERYNTERRFLCQSEESRYQ